MITKLELDRFQKHTELTVEFGQGLNLVVGDNWAGKTTILRGIQYAMFGSNAIDTKTTEIATNGANGFSVRLHFTIDFAKYVVYRTKTTAEIRLVEDDRIIASGHTGVTKEIEDLFGTSAKHFSLLNCVQQGEADQLLLMNAVQINTLLNEVTGIGLIADVSTYAKSKVTQLGWAEQAKASWEHKVRERESALRTAQEALSSTQGWMDTYTPQFQEIKKGKEQLYHHLRSLEDAYQAGGAQREKALRLEGSLQQLRDTPVAFPGDRPNQSEHEELRIALSRLETAKESTTNLNARKKLLEADLRGAESSVRLLEKELEGLGPIVTYDDLETEIKERELELLKIEQSLAHLWKQKKDAVCDVCGSLLQEVDPAELDERIARMEASQEELNAVQRKQVAELNDAEQNNRAIEIKENTLQQWKAKASEIEDDLLRLIDQVSELSYDKDKHAELKARFSEVDKQIADYDNALNAYNKYVEDCESLEKLLEALKGFDAGPTMDEVMAARHVYDNQCAAYQSWDEVFTKQKSQLEKAQTEAGMLEASLKSDRQQLDEASRQFIHYDNWKKLNRFLTVNRDRYLQDIWESVLGYATRFSTEATSGKITRILRTTNGKFSYVENGYERSIGPASGLQKAIIGLSIKLAMGLALGSGRRLLLLDEVTAAAKDENSLLISQLLAGYGGQVIMVTHRPEDAAVADHVVTV